MQVVYVFFLRAAADFSTKKIDSGLDTGNDPTYNSVLNESTCYKESIMATQSVIAEQFEDNSIRAISCHYGGHPSRNGEILRLFYDTSKTVSRMIKLGDMVSLAETVKDCEYYGRDRGESGVDGTLFWSPSEFYLSSLYRSHPYVYIFYHETEEWQTIPRGI